MCLSPWGLGYVTRGMRAEVLIFGIDFTSSRLIVLLGLIGGRCASYDFYRCLQGGSREEAFIEDQGLQPPSFNGEGSKVEQDAKVWIESMSDYFSIVVGTTPTN